MSPAPPLARPVRWARVGPGAPARPRCRGANASRTASGISILFVAVSRTARIALIVGGVLALLGYLLILELGINAGRIHYGVTVRGGVDVGGMTAAEAFEALEEQAQQMLADDIVLGGQGVYVRFYPRRPEWASEDRLQASWSPRRSDTVQAALAVGREDAPFGALADRFRGWFGGVKVNWMGKARSPSVTKILDKVERLGARDGLVLDRTKLRLKIRRALNSWPRRPFYRIPFTDGA